MKKIPILIVSVILIILLVGAWTDDILSDTTIIKKIHVQEQRDSIDAIRSDIGLSSYSWNDSNLTTNTPVKTIHFTDLSTAIDEIYTAIGTNNSSWPGIAADDVIFHSSISIRRENITSANNTIQNYTCCGSYGGSSTGSVGSCPGSDDSSCGTIDCDGLNYYFTSGSASPIGTNYCKLRDYADITSNRCEGIDDCKDANSGDCTSYSDSTVATCGVCKYATGACTSCTNYASGTNCGGSNSCDGQGYCVPPGW